MNTSYIQILQAIEAFSSAHLQIKKFASDFPEQMPNFATTDEKYPILFVSPTNAIFDLNVNTFVLTVYCFDIIQKDRSNINYILSDTNQILNDLYRWFKDGEIAGIDIIDVAPNVIPLNNKLLDYASGWQMNITFVTNSYGICEIPFNTVPVITTEVNSIEYSDFLTCNSLDTCQTIIDIQNKLDMPVSVVSPTNPNRTLKITIGGVDYYIAAKTTND